jgi:hypothetical protein
MSDILLSLGVDPTGFIIDLQNSERAQDAAFSRMEARYEELAATVSAVSKKMRDDFLRSAADIRKAATDIAALSGTTLNPKATEDSTQRTRTAVRGLSEEAKAAKRQLAELQSLLSSGRSLEGLLKTGNAAGAADSLAQVQKYFRRLSEAVDKLNGQPLNIKTDTAVRNLRVLETRLKALTTELIASSTLRNEGVGSAAVSLLRDRARDLSSLRNQIVATGSRGTPVAVEQINAALAKTQALLARISATPLDIGGERAIRDLQTAAAKLERLKQTIERPVRAGKAPSTADPDLASARLLTAQTRGLLGEARAGGVGLDRLKAKVAEIGVVVERLRAKPVTLDTARALSGLEGLSQRVQKLVADMQRLPSARIGAQTLNQEFQKLGGILRNVSTVLSTLGVGGGIFALIYGFKAMVADGVQFNALLETARIALGASVQATAEKITLDGTQLTGLAAIQGVQGNINLLVSQLRRDALFVSGSFSDLLDISTSIVPIVLRLGGSMADVERLTRLTGIAASVYGLNFKVATNGVIQLLNGTLNKRNELVKRLPIESFAGFRKSLDDVGSRLTTVTAELEKLQAAAPLLEVSYTAALESVKDLTQQLFAGTFAPLQQRLQRLFVTTVAASVKTATDGTVQYTEQFQAVIDQASRIVAQLVSQVTVLSRELFSVPSGETFLDALERNLPTVTESIFSLLRVFKSVFDTLTANGGLVLKVIGYFLTFQLARGVVVSTAAAVGNLTTSMAALFDGVRAAATAVAGFRSQMAAGTLTVTGATQALGTFGVALRGLGVIGVLVFLAELAQGFIRARDDAQSVQAALKDLNAVRFDGAITELRRLQTAIAEAGITKFLTDFTGDAARVKQAAELVSGARGALQSSSTAAGFAGGGDLSTAREVLTKYQDRKTRLTSQVQGAVDPRRRKVLLDEAAALEVAKEAAENYLVVVASAAKIADTARDRGLGTGLTGRELPSALSKARREAGELRRLRVEIEASGKAATIETRRAAPPPPKVDAGAAGRLQDTRNDVLNAFKAELEARQAAAERAARADQEAVEASVAAQVRTEQTAASESLRISEDMYSAKLQLLAGYYAEVERLLRAEVKRLGVGSFTDLLGLSPEALEKKLREFSVAALSGPQDAGTKARNDASIDAVKRLIDIRRQALVAGEALDQASAKSDRDVAVANLRRVEFTQESLALSAERLAQARLEDAQVRATSDALDERIQQEENILRLQQEQLAASAREELTRQLSDIQKRNNGEDKTLLTRKAQEANAEQLRVNAAKAQAATLRNIIGLLDAEFRLRQEALGVDEIRLSTTAELLGQDNLITIGETNRLKQKKAQLALEEAIRKEQLASAAEARGDGGIARQLRTQADQLRATSDQFTVSQLNYIQTVGTQIGVLDRVLGSFGARLQVVGQAQNAALSIGAASNALNAKGGIGGIFNSGKGNSTGILGGLKGGLAVAGVFGEVAGSVISLFKGFFSLVNAGFSRLLEQSKRDINQQIDRTLGDLRNGFTTTGKTIEALREQSSKVGSQLPQAKISGLFNFLTFGIAGAAVRKQREQAIKEIQQRVQDEIAALEQSARDAIRRLDEETLPSLRVLPEARQTVDAIRSLRKEIEEYLSLPGANEASVNELFNLRVIDLQRDAQERLRSAKQEYLDLIKSEASLSAELQDLERERTDAIASYAARRADILGVVRREETRGGQLKALKEQRDAELARIAAQKQETEDRLAGVRSQTALYAEQFGVVRDIRTFELQMQNELLQKDRERLSALQQSLLALQQVSNLTAQSFASLGAAALSGLGISPTSTVTNNNNQTSVTIGSITIGAGTNITPGQVRDSVVEALRSIQQTQALQGPAFSQA